MTETTIRPHRFGWKPSLPDFHDVVADARDLTVLDEVDPRADMPPVYDQGNLGSCTANAISGALQYDRMLSGETDAPVPSRLFLYYEERVKEGSVSTDSGAYGRDGFKVLRKIGCPPESVWPYIVEGFATKPSQEAFDDAAKYRIGTYIHPGAGQGATLLDRQEAFKRLLSNHQTVAFGFTVYESFEAGWEDGLMPMPEKGEKVLGGHEVLLVGYLAEQPEYALVRNSWGSGWQREGYFLMPWKFLCDPAFAGDWRSIYREAGK